METSSLAPIFIPVTTDITPLVEIESKGVTDSELRRAASGVGFNTAYDFFRHTALAMAEEGRFGEAERRLTAIDLLLSRMEQNGIVPDTHAALMQVLTALYLRAGRLDDAMVTAAKVLNLLSQSPKRKDEPFLSVLAALLHDIALIHSLRGEFRQAEREIEKSIKVLERLVRTNPERYGSAHITAMNTATHVYRSRQRQTELLAKSHETVVTCLREAESGAAEAVSRLVDSMAEEGTTLLKMGRHREAIQYLSRALKYLTRIEPDLTLRQLDLSISLGEALLAVSATREKGIHLLNTMLHKATKLHADDRHRRVVDILVNARSRRLDILGIWHKFFPR
ncbi:MAG: hypothetical protein NC336_02385 [Clostridium sp.]|nr:hypothetical protein [Clostridium sp.]